MIYKFAAIGAIALMVTGCVSPQDSEVFKVNTIVNKTENTNVLAKAISKNSLEIKNLIRKRNGHKLEVAMANLKKHVNKTWYVFSGATPSGWDCSGLVMWTYDQLGIKLEHRASKQAEAGKKVKHPKLGDLVVFRYKGSKSAYHVGIYYKNGTMIHAPRKGQRTRYESIVDFANGYSNVSYVRLIDTL